MSWLNNSVIYQIFIDRFAGFSSTGGWQEPEYLGGNIRGIIDKFEYLKDLGVNVLWLSPFFEGVAYHGYHITDFNSVDEHFGSEADVAELLSLAHDAGMKIICDFVPNHCSNQHPFFVDARENPDSKYRDWFHFFEWPNKYECFQEFDILPKLNLDNGAVRDHLRSAAKKWLDLGFDGLRVDHVVGISNKNLKRLFDPLRVEFPDAVFIGEAWFADIPFKYLRTLRVPHKYLVWAFGLDGLLYRNYRGILDGVLDFRTAKYLEKYAKSKDEEKQLVSRIKREASSFGDKLSQVTFLDNHDMERFLFRVGGDISKLEKAATLQFSLHNPTVIYYGTEIGLSQTESFASRSSYADILARQPMEWDKSKQNSSLLEFYKAIIAKKLSR